MVNEREEICDNGHIRAEATGFPQPEIAPVADKCRRTENQYSLRRG
jgi:hypothetical protein